MIGWFTRKNHYHALYLAEVKKRKFVEWVNESAEKRYEEMVHKLDERDKELHAVRYLLEETTAERQRYWKQVNDLAEKLSKSQKELEAMRQEQILRDQPQAAADNQRKAVRSDYDYTRQYSSPPRDPYSSR